MLINHRITMGEVLDTEDFRDAELVAGGAGLTNELSWVHILETWDDSNKWIDGNELILCSAVGVKKGEQLIPFFKQLLEKKISGFCLQLNMYVDEVPQEMIRLANRHKVPLLVFHRLVRFIDLSRNLIRIILEYVNQDYLLEKQKLDANYWMLDWLNGNISEQRIAEHLEMSRFELKKIYWFITVVEYRKSKITYQWSESIYLSIAKALRMMFEEQQFIFYPFFANGLLTGIVMDYGPNDTWKERFETVTEHINKNLRIQEGKPQLLLACGYRSNDVKDIPRSYKTALGTMDICQKFQGEHHIYEDLNLYFILSLIKDSNHMDDLKDFVMDQIKPLLTFDISHNGKLMQTLKKYYENNGNKQLTAQDLNITRQSLYYRLEQIEDILGMDPLSPQRRLTLEMCLSFYDYFLKMQ